MANGNDIHGIATKHVYKVPESSVLLIFTQGRHNEQFNEPKKSIELEECEANSLVIKPQSLASNDTSLNASNLNNESKMPQIVQKGGSDFGMPAVNTKLKHADNSIVTNNQPIGVKNNLNLNQIETQFNILQNPHNVINTNVVPTTQSQECHDGTKALKSILGLSDAPSQPYINAVPQQPLLL